MIEAMEALKFAAVQHRGQVDKQGVPFIEHPIAVARNVVFYFDRPPLVPAAFLHDVVEDTDTTLDDLSDHGFSERTITLVDYMTRRENETYSTYIERVAGDYDASCIKRADIYHNTDPTRVISESLQRRYVRALQRLPHHQ